MIFLVIYYSFTVYELMMPCVHCLHKAKLEANGEMTSGIASRLKVILNCSDHKAIGNIHANEKSD